MKRSSAGTDGNAALDTNEVFNTLGIIYTLTLSANTEQGPLTATESAPYAAGTLVHLTATPLAGFQVSQWNGTDNDALTGTTNTVIMTDDKTVSVSFVEGGGEGEGEGEGEQIGSLNVTIEPENAKNAGAQWRVDGGGWQNSRVTLSGLNVGQHLVEFKDIPAEESSGCFGSKKKPWTTPASQNVNVTAGQTTAITGTYVLSEKALAASIPGSGARGDLLLVSAVASVLWVSRRRRILVRDLIYKGADFEKPGS